MKSDDPYQIILPCRLSLRFLDDILFPVSSSAAPPGAAKLLDDAVVGLQTPTASQTTSEKQFGSTQKKIDDKSVIGASLPSNYFSKELMRISIMSLRYINFKGLFLYIIRFSL